MIINNRNNNNDDNNGNNNNDDHNHNHSNSNDANNITVSLRTSGPHAEPKQPAYLRCAERTLGASTIRRPSRGIT